MNFDQLPGNLKVRLLLQGKTAKSYGSSAGGGKKQQQQKQEAEKPKQLLAERNAPVVESPEAAAFGDLKIIQSAYKTNRVFTAFKDLGLNLDGQHVWIRGRADTVRGKGKMAFMVMRRGVYTVQTMLSANDVPKEMVAYVGKIPTESIVDLYGKVVKVPSPTKTTQKDVEIHVEKVFVVSASDALPFQLEDASRPEAPEGKAETKEASGPTVGQDTRLDNRCIDLRTRANHAIFRLQSAVGTYFREYFLNLGFVEIHTPKITPGVSEGGAAVFRLEYFGKPACLAQSPQLYKQMATACSDLFRVFEVAPVFRAENSFTHRHLCEFMGLDFEMEIIEHYHEVLKVLGDLFVYIFDKLNAHHKDELEAVRSQYPFEDLVYRKETLVLSFADAVKLLREDGETIGDFEDFSTPQEKRLGRIVKAKYNTDFYIVDQYPKAARPFYTMPNAADPRYTNSYDVFLRGEEITSGAQRVHDVELLKTRAVECGIPLDNITAYLESFRYGVPPHGGAGIGLERVVMLFMGLNNIRKSSMFPRDPLRLSP